MTTPTRAEAAAALLNSIRDLMDVVDRMQVAAAWVLDAYGDQLDAETVRMLRLPGGPERPGRPPVPPLTPHSVTVTDSGMDDEDGEA